jgi:uncharacterized caspase-like protein
MKQQSSPVIIAATTDNQPAAENLHGHGYFTYALLSAIGQAAADEDGRLSQHAIITYVGDVLPKLTKYRQEPLFSDVGPTFKLVKKTPVLQLGSTTSQ